MILRTTCILILKASFTLSDECDLGKESDLNNKSKLRKESDLHNKCKLRKESDLHNKCTPTTNQHGNTSNIMYIQ